MMIKKIALICVLSLLLSSAGLVFAGETNSEPFLYPLRELVEEGVIALTDSNVGKADWYLNFAEERINMLNEEVRNGNRPGFVDELLAKNGVLIEQAEAQVIEAAENEEVDLNDVIERVEINHETRKNRLQSFLDDENFNSQAKAGIKNAMNKQEEAFDKFEAAINRAIDARQNGQGVNNAPQETDPDNGEGNNPDWAPPENPEDLNLGDLIPGDKGNSNR